MLLLPLLAVLAQTPPVPVPVTPTPPTSRWSNATDIELVADERDSLKGVSRLALTVNLPDTLAGAIDAAALTSTLAFQLEQAGLVVTSKRAVEEPLLAVSVRVVDDRDARGARVVYRVYADLLQLVRLADLDGRARLMMASTWHAGSFGTIAASDTDGLRTRIGEVIDTFLADRRAVPPPVTPGGPALSPR